MSDGWPVIGWPVGRSAGQCLTMIILPLCGSILQVWTCQIFSFPKYPRWSQVWHWLCLKNLSPRFVCPERLLSPKILLGVTRLCLERLWSVNAEIQDLKHWCGRVVGRPVPDNNITTLWLHLASWNLLDFQLNWKSKMEPSVAIIPLRGSILQAGNCQILRSKHN